MIVSSLAALLFLPQAQTATADFTTEWDKVRSAIERRYFAREKQKDRMKGLLDKYEPKAQKSGTRDEFANAVNEMIDEFGDSHFDFFTPDDQGYYVMDNLANRQDPAKMPNVGIWFRRGSDSYTVQMVVSGSAAAEAGILKGDRITTSGFGPISTFRDKEVVDLRVSRGGKERTVSLPVDHLSPMEMFLQATKRSIRVIEHGGKRYGYIHLWTMGSSAFKDVMVQAVKGPLAETDGIILDLRDGFGGTPHGYLDVFFTPDVKVTYGSRGVGMSQRDGYEKPVVALINEGTRSAKEVSSAVLKKTGRATLVGKNTAGHVLGTGPLKLNDWSYLEIPMVEVFVDGENLEKKGVSPNIKVEREYGPNGEDLILKRGLEEIQKKTAKKV